MEIEKQRGYTEDWFRLSVEKERERHPQLKDEMIAELRTFLQDRPHMPPVSDVELIHHIQSCEFKEEEAKRALEVNYTIRSRAEFFKERDPQARHVVDTSRSFMQCVIRDADKQGRVALLARLNDTDPAKYDFNHSARLTTLLLDLMRLEYGTVNGFTAIVDLTGFSLSHLIKAPFGSLRHFMRYLQEGCPSKMVAIHMINTRGSIIDKVMVLIRPLLSERITKVMYIHPGSETLYDHGLKFDKMPTEFGGAAGPFVRMSDETYERLLEYRDYFLEEQNQRIDETKRPKSARAKYFGLF